MSDDWFHNVSVRQELGGIRTEVGRVNTQLEELALPPEERVARRAARASQDRARGLFFAGLAGLVVVGAMLGRLFADDGFRGVVWVVGAAGYLIAAAIPVCVVIAIGSAVWSALRPRRGSGA